MLQAYVSSVSDIYEVYRKCFICMLQKYIGMLHKLHGYEHMLQASVLNVSSVFLRRFVASVLYFYLDIAICFAMSFQVFPGVFTSISDAYLKCFISLDSRCKCFIGCFKSRSGAVHVAI